MKTNFDIFSHKQNRYVVKLVIHFQKRFWNIKIFIELKWQKRKLNGKFRFYN